MHVLQEQAAPGVAVARLVLHKLFHALDRLQHVRVRLRGRGRRHRLRRSLRGRRRDRGGSRRRGGGRAYAVVVLQRLAVAARRAVRRQRGRVVAAERRREHQRIGHVGPRTGHQVRERVDAVALEVLGELLGGEREVFLVLLEDEALVVAPQVEREHVRVHERAAALAEHIDRALQELHLQQRRGESARVFITRLRRAQQTASATATAAALAAAVVSTGILCCTSGIL